MHRYPLAAAIRYIWKSYVQIRMRVLRLHIFFALLISTQWASAQLCTGSLGDPILQVTFGNGSGPGPALPAGKTTHQYVTDACPKEGEYSILNLSFGCFNQQWHTVVGDHTPNDANGYYLMVNSAVNPGYFYCDTLRGLCPNTNYEFAAWFKNVFKPGFNGSSPDISFQVEALDGTVLKTYNTGFIAAEATSSWRQYGLFFASPAGTNDIVIRLKNNVAGGLGNDFAIDDITIRPCGPRLVARVDQYTEDLITLCESNNQSLTLSGSFTPGVYANPNLQWQISNNGIDWTHIPGAVNLTWNRVATGRGQFFYRLLIADGPNLNTPSCRLASNIVTIIVTQPDAQVTNYVFGCYGAPIGFYAAGGSSYSWRGPNGFTSNLQGPKIDKVIFENTGWYVVTVTDSHGCSDSDSTNLIVYPAAHAAIEPAGPICEGRSTTLKATGGIQYAWSPAKGLSDEKSPQPIASPTDTTLYKLVVFNEYGCYDTTSIRLDVWKKPVANAGPDTRTRLGFPASLSGSIRGTDIRYYWTPAAGVDNPTSLKINVNLSESTTYTLHAVSNRGCGESTDQAFIRVYEQLLIPNAFSPNGDGINDYWVIEPLNYFEDALTTVYNRNGSPVFTSRGYAKPWDGTINGKPVPAGMYYYVIDLKTPREPIMTGSVLVLR